MSEIVVVGLGPGPVEMLTVEAKDFLSEAKQIFFRYSAHPVFVWARGMGIECISFDYLYAVPGITYAKLYKTITEAVVRLALEQKQVIYALPGHPYVFERTGRWIKLSAEAQGIKVRLIAGMSFLEQLYLELDIEPAEGLQIYNALDLAQLPDCPFTERTAMLIGQVGLPLGVEPSSKETNISAMASALLKKFPAGHPATLVLTRGLPEYKLEKQSIRIQDLKDMKDFGSNLASLFIPAVKKER